MRGGESTPGPTFRSPNADRPRQVKEGRMDDLHDMFQDYRLTTAEIL